MSKDLQSAPAQSGAADQGGAVENGEKQSGVVEQGERKGLRQAPEASRMQGHWLLATLGKKILRPGGIALTRKMLAAAAPTSQDRIVEFGPGVGPLRACY